MKKIIGLIAALFTSAVLFAAVPAKNLIVGVHDFATHPSSDWEVYDGWHCKSCGLSVFSDDSFCPVCGQAIDWR